MHLRLLPITALCALLLAACGSSTSPQASVSGGAKPAGAIALASCMRTHGVPQFSDTPLSAGGGVNVQAKAVSGSGQSLSINGVQVNAPAFQRAMSACQKYLPHGGGSGNIAQLRKNALKMAQCMRANGVPNFPDPTVTKGPFGGNAIRLGGQGIDPQSPAFQSAQQKCGSLIGGPKGFFAARAIGPKG